MPPNPIQAIFKPRSVALFGASDRPGSLGRVVMENLRSAGFAGPIYLINPKHNRVAEERTFASIRDVREDTDLAVIVTPAATVPDIISECGEAGVRAAVVISAGFRESGPAGLALERDVLRRARQFGLRFLGPNCLGVVRTDIGFNATFSDGNALPGRIAVVSQSGALCTAIMDWARTHDVGFSSLISTGIGADVDFGEILDFLVTDPQTDSIMLYIEGVHDARRFVSALRAAARVKPVVVMKAGRHAEGSRAALSHTGALVGSDDVFDAALRRAGVLRVVDFARFFAAAATLDSGVRARGNRLTIITNAGGPAVMAADHTAGPAVSLAELAPDTVAKLDAALPASWSHGNPVDVLGDATPERYLEAIQICLEDPSTDALVVILTPQALTSPDDVAQQITGLREQFRKPVFTCWMGDGAVAAARDVFRQHNIPTFGTPESAVDAFSALCAYRENQLQLLQVPEPLSREAAPDLDGARLIIDSALAEGRTVLGLAESKALLSAFHIPIVQSLPARTASDAALMAQEIGFPVAMKIKSPDITHKTDVGGVRLGLSTGRDVRSAFQEMTDKVAAVKPEARIEGVFIEPMWPGRRGRELMIGVISDDVFGPVISFGLGGTLVEIMGDRAVALPPLNRFLIQDLIRRTKAAKYMAELRGAPAVDQRAVENLLLRVSEMVCELPRLQEVDMNPVMANETGVVVVDARIVVRRRSASARPYDHMAIHPYPSTLERQLDLSDGTTVTIRPIRPENAAMERDFVNGLSERSKYMRFMNVMAEITPGMLSRFTQIDYDREMALIAVVQENGTERQIAVARYATLSDEETCEFAIVIGDEWQGRGLANPLMATLIEIARDRRLKRMDGIVLRNNRPMLTLARAMGFETLPSDGDADTVRVSLPL